MADMDDDALLDALGVDLTPEKAASRTPREERLIAGFEDILRFHQTHGRAPQHGEERDIFERLYAVRLERLRALPEAQALLARWDAPGLLAGANAVADEAELDDGVLLAELGIDVDGSTSTADPNAITRLHNVRPHAARRAAEDIANRSRCADFERFKPLFEQVADDLQHGVRLAIPLQTRALDEIAEGSFFIVGGQVAYVAEERDAILHSYDRRDRRLRVIYDNGTEGEVLQRSLQRALHRDKRARLVAMPDAGSLFGDTPEPDDIESGTIYVLRSLSSHPFIAAHRELIHKIGVTGGKVEARIAGAAKDATYLLAEVEVVATYRLHNLNRVRLENLFHRLFAAAQLDLTLEDRFGQPVKPREWFLLPLAVIDEAVCAIRDGTLSGRIYDPISARLVTAG